MTSVAQTKGDPKDFGATIDRQAGLTEVDDWVMCIDFVGVGGEERDRGFA